MSGVGQRSMHLAFAEESANCFVLRKPEDDAGIREPDFKKAFEMTNLKRDERP